MALEIEVKVALTDAALAQRKLAQAGARLEAMVFERNYFFDWPDGRLKRADQGLRLRVAEMVGRPGPQRVSLTHKGKRQEGEVKTREETELVVDDAGAARRLLESLGFEEVLFFEKFRRLWRLGECEVVVDTLPGLGDFLEIEGPSAALVHEARSRLSLAGQPLVAETYAELLARSEVGRAGMRHKFSTKQLEALRASGCGPLRG